MKWLSSLNERQTEAVVMAIFLVMLFGSLAAVGIADGCSYRECVKTHAPKECK